MMYFDLIMNLLMDTNNSCKPTIIREEKKRVTNIEYF